MKRDKWTFFAGSLVGFGQAVASFLVGMRYGAFMGACASLLTYVVFERLYLWVTEDVDDDSTPPRR